MIYFAVVQDQQRSLHVEVRELQKKMSALLDENASLHATVKDQKGRVTGMQKKKEHYKAEFCRVEAEREGTQVVMAERENVLQEMIASMETMRMDSRKHVEQLEAKNHVYEESSSEQLVMDLCLASDVIVAELVL